MSDKGYTIEDPSDEDGSWGMPPDSSPPIEKRRLRDIRLISAILTDTLPGIVQGSLLEKVNILRSKFKTDQNLTDYERLAAVKDKHIRSAIEEYRNVFCKYYLDDNFLIERFGNSNCLNTRAAVIMLTGIITSLKEIVQYGSEIELPSQRKPTTWHTELRKEYNRNNVPEDLKKLSIYNLRKYRIGEDGTKIILKGQLFKLLKDPDVELEQLEMSYFEYSLLTDLHSLQVISELSIKIEDPVFEFYLHIFHDVISVYIQQLITGKGIDTNKDTSFSDITLQLTKKEEP